MTRVLKRVRAELESRFPERQIYHQAHGELKFIRVTTTQQTIALAAGIGLSIWLLVATLGASLTALVVGNGAAYIAKVEDRYEAGIAAAEAREAEAEKILAARTRALQQSLAEIEQRQRALEALMKTAAGAAPAGATEGRTSKAEAVAPARSVEDQTQKLKRQQEAFLRETSAQAAERAALARQSLRAMGVKPPASATGQGGPFIPLTDYLAERGRAQASQSFDRLLREARARLSEAATLEAVLAAAPTGAPINQPFALTSDYGPRRDPFTGGYGWHGGVDLVAAYGAPIVAAAPGVVTFVGWKSGYGHTVEVDHGHGFSTLYAHLTGRFPVSVGDRVARGEPLGALGNSGRSTGPHLHFEVLLHGETYDPERFMAAGGNVWTER